MLCLVVGVKKLYYVFLDFHFFVQKNSWIYLIDIKNHFVFFDKIKI